MSKKTPDFNSKAILLCILHIIPNTVVDVSLLTWLKKLVKLTNIALQWTVNKERQRKIKRTAFLGAVQIAGLTRNWMLTNQNQ